MTGRYRTTLCPPTLNKVRCSCVVLVRFRSGECRSRSGKCFLQLPESRSITVRCTVQGVISISQDLLIIFLTRRTKQSPFVLRNELSLLSVRSLKRRRLLKKLPVLLLGLLCCYVPFRHLMFNV